MSLDNDHKATVNVPGFAVKVLGGTFQVNDVLTLPHQTPEAVVAHINATPADRWFVMVSDDPAEEQDSLAMIDDDLEFQIYAHGLLRQD